LVADVETDVGNHGEGVVLVVSDVGGQGQEAPVCKRRWTAGRRERRVAVDIDRLMGIAEGHFAGDIEKGPAPPPLGASAYLTAIEVVVRRKLVENANGAAADNGNARIDR